MTHSLLSLGATLCPTLFPYTTLFRSKTVPTARSAATARQVSPQVNARTRAKTFEKLTRIWIINARYPALDRKSTRLNSSHVAISSAVFCLKQKTKITLENIKPPHQVV